MENNYLSTQPNIRSKIFGLIPVILILFSFVFVSPDAFGQKEKDVEIIRECIEYLGNGNYQVNFGYDNPNKKEIDVSQENSIVEKNSGNAYGHNKFKPGRQYNVFSEPFKYNERVKWTVILPNGSTKEVYADANSSHCSGEESNIIPLFDGANEGGVLWPELYWLSQQTGDKQSNEIFQIDNSIPGNEKVLIEVIALENINTATLLSELSGIGFVGIDEGNNPLIYTGFCPIVNLGDFNKNPLLKFVKFVRPMFTPGLNGQIQYDYQGLVNTEQDVALRSRIVRSAFGLTGQGVTVGVLSDSYGTPPTNSEDVPQGSKMQVIKDLANLGPFSGGTDEGRAMIEQAFDIAPGADYKFWTGVGSAELMAKGIRSLAIDEQCDIIVDDITHLAEPFMPKGQIAKAVEEVTELGVHYVSSAGNYRDAGFRGAFNGSPIPANFTAFSGSGAEAHNFGNSSSDYPQVQQVSLIPGVYIIAMQWDDDFYAQNENLGALYDLDFWILDKSGNKKYYGNRLNVGEDPIELLGFQVLFPTEVYVMITGENIDKPLNFEYIVFRAPLDTDPAKSFGWKFTNGDSFNAATVVGHSALVNGSSVGAAFYGYTPEFENKTGTEMLEAFSSRGGTNLIGQPLEKPDFIAPDGGNNSFFGSDNTFDDTDGYNDGEDFFDGKNFFGTSAAAPAVAAVEALILEASKKYINNSTTQPIKKEFHPYLDLNGKNSLKTVLKKSALDVGLPATAGGAGLVQADRALLAMGNPSPKILSLSFDEVNPGLKEFIMTISMQYPVTDEAGDPIVYAVDEDGQPNGATAITFLGDTLSWEQASWEPADYVLTMTVNIPEFTGNPPITLTNGSADGTLPESNGGTNSQNILDVPKDYVLIKAKNDSKLYGQDVPVYTDNINGLTYEIYTRDADLNWIPSTNPEHEVLETALTNVITLTIPDAEYDAEIGEYSINISIEDQTAFDALTADYNIVNFIDGGVYANQGEGTLIIEQLPVTVKPKDILDAVYGQKINIELDYIFDETNMTDPDSVSALIKTSHDKLLAPSDFFVIPTRGANLIDRGANLVDRGANLIDRGANLIDRGANLVDGSSWMMTQIALSRGAALIDGGNMVFEIGDDLLLDDREIYTASSTERGAALIDASEILDGTASIFDRGANLVDRGANLIDRGANLIDRGANLIDAEDQAIADERDLKLFFIASDGEPTNEDDVYLVNFEDMKSVNFVSGLDVLPPYTDEKPYRHYIAPGTLLNKNLIVTYDIGDLIFKPRDITIQVEDKVENQEKIFGTVDPTFTYLITSGSLIPEKLPNTGIPNDPGNPGDAFFGSLTREPGEDVDSYDIKLGDLEAGPKDGILNTNDPTPVIPFGLNYNITLEGDPTFEINKALASVKFSNLTFTYDGSPKSPEVTTIPDNLNVKLIYLQDIGLGVLEVLQGPPENVGSYQIKVELVDEPNYYLNGGFVTQAFTINPAPVTLTFEDINIEFSGDELEPTVSTSIGNLGVILTYRPVINEEVLDQPLDGAPVDAGTYQVTVQLSSANFSINGTNTAIFTIEQAPVTLNFDDLTTTFNGLAQEPTVTTTLPLFHNVVLTYTQDVDEVIEELTSPPVNAGKYQVTVELNEEELNYIISGSNAAEFTITPAALTVIADSFEKVYGVGDPGFTFKVSTLTPLKNGDTENNVFSGTLERVGGESVSGSPYAITNDNNTLTAGDNYVLSVEPGTLTITPAALTVIADSFEKVYGVGDPGFTFKVSTLTPLKNGDTENNVFSGTLERVGGESVIGSPYAITNDNNTLTAGDNYVLSVEPGTLTITPAALTITAVQKEIFFEGDTDLNAVFDFTVTGFIGNLGVLDVGVAGYTSPSAIPAGNYALKYNSTIPNYVIDNAANLGTLYVNPFGSSTPNVHPRLNCIQYDEATGEYVAHMYYDNPNPFTLFIPEGPNNHVYYVDGNVSVTGLVPQLFNPGIHTFDVPFNGTKMIWELTSYKTSLTAAMSSDASVTSQRCDEDILNSGARTSGPEIERTTSSTFDLSTITGYPNPVSDMYYVNLSEKQVSSVKVSLVDIQGKMYNVQVTPNPSRRRLEVDLTNLNSGLYMLKLDLENDQKILKVIKQ